MENFIGLNIKYICVKKKLSQKEFGDLFGIKQNTISGYIGGRTEPNITFLQNVSKHFDITIDDFINEDLAKKGYKTGFTKEPDLETYGDPAIIIKSQGETIAAQAKTIAAQEKQITLLESIASGNFKQKPKAS